MWRKEKDRDRRLLKRTKPLVCFTFAIMVNMLVNEAFIFVVLSAISSEPYGYCAHHVLSMEQTHNS